MFGDYPGDLSGAFLQLPAGAIAGTPTVTPPATFTTINRTELLAGTPTHTIHLDAGESVMLAVLEDWLYLEPPSGLTQGYYILTGTGLGGVEVADAFDLGYNYPSVTPTWTVQPVVGTSSDGISYWQMNPAFLDVSHLWNDGWPLVRLTCTTGAADITFVGAQIEVAGMWLADGGFVWSADQPATYQEPPMNGLGTYLSYVDGSDVNRWVVDNGVVQYVTLTSMPGGDFYIDAWEGSVTSELSASDARAQSLADFGPWTELSVTQARADLIHFPETIDVLGVVPEHWDAALFEKVTLYTAPSRAVNPSTPEGYLGIPPWLRMGLSGFEWIGDDRSILGWHIYNGNVTFLGDNDTFT